ncbi:MAG TPA: hypothetical protein VL307_19705, partial [Chitinophagaceae bacterium]|nr:hypothetical protein [Chitinophagaceae bacterium]
MYLRFLLLWLILSLSLPGTAQNVMSPLDGDYIYDPNAPAGSLNNPVPVNGKIQHWVHDTSQHKSVSFYQGDFKSYRYNNMSFRLRFPEHYDPSKKYPLIVFLHGGGEAAELSNAHNAAGINRDNGYQLFVGANTFRYYIYTGSFNAFLLFPQLMVDDNGAGAQWDATNISPLNDILDTLQMYNGLDADRVISMGISAGALGAVKYASLFPKRIAAVIASSPPSLTDVSGNIDAFVHVPLYIAAGGKDINPYPITVLTVHDQFNAKGGNFFLTYYPTAGHYTWDAQWAQRTINGQSMLTDYWNRASKAQPLLYYQNNTFCNTDPVRATMGVTPGFFAYEWQRDDGNGFSNITGAGANVFTATAPGRYRARYKATATAEWSAWSANPIVISVKSCAVGDTVFAEHFDEAPVNNYVTFNGTGTGNSAYYKYNTGCQNGLFVNGTEVFTQDASGVQGGRFMLNNTTDDGCTYITGDQVWRTYFPVTVSPNTDYTLSFYMSNQGLFKSDAPTETAAALLPTINNTPLSPAVQTLVVGDVGWKKYSFHWHSGASTTAEIAITNNTATGVGNDFVLDDISLVKSTPSPTPGGAFKFVQLWVKGNDINGADGSKVAIWPNSTINGNNLLQPFSNSQPVLETKGADNINNNPVTTYNNATNKFMYVPGGFAGSSSPHQAVYAFLVTKAYADSQDAELLREGPDNNLVLVKTQGTAMKWAGGEDHFIETPA